jgi:glycosyltransferase involved in cell wall biosynthesis
MNSKHSPLVSVIIPFYNEETFLAEAVESVLQQTYTHWELLLVDDGSTNRAVQIAKEFSQRHPGKIFYIEHEGRANKGAAASRNAGLRQAKGELIAFLDADDIWLPEKLQHQVSIFQENPGVGLVAEASLYWYSWAKSSAENRLVQVGVPSEQVYQPMELNTLLYPLQPQPCACPSALMVTREAVSRGGGFEESFIREYAMYEDQAFLSKIYLKEKVYISSACHNLYRIREGSVEQSAKANGHYHLARQFFLHWFEEYLQQKQIQVAGISKLLRHALMPYREPGRYFLTCTLPKQVRRVVKRGLHKLALT